MIGRRPDAAPLPSTSTPDRGEDIQLGVFAFGLDQLGPAVHLHQHDHGSRLPESPQRHRLQDLLRSATGSPIRASRLFKAGAHCQERGPVVRSTSASSHLRAAVSLWPYTNPSRLHGGWCTQGVVRHLALVRPQAQGPAPPSSPRLPGPRMHTPPVDRCWTDESLQCSLRRPVTASTGCPAPRAPHGTRGVPPEGLWTRCAQTCVGDR